MAQTKPSKAFTDEVQRNDTLLAKWGILVGNLGGSRGRRRAIATSMARENSGVLTDLVMEAFIAEAKLQSVKNALGWIAGILEDDHERASYLPEIVKLAAGKGRAAAKQASQHGPGDRGLDPSSREAMEREAAKQGKTMNEIVYQKRRALMFAQYWGDGHAISQIAQGQNITEELARSEIDKEMQVQWDRMPFEAELDTMAKAAGMSVADYRQRIMDRFELKEQVWFASIEAAQAFKITSKAKEGGWENPLVPMTLVDWEFLVGEKRKRARAAALAPKPEAPAQSRAQKLKELRDAPLTEEED